MIIEVGQSADGRWAWMIREADGPVRASHDGYLYTEEALSVAMARAKELRVEIDNIRIHRPTR